MQDIQYRIGMCLYVCGSFRKQKLANSVHFNKLITDSHLKMSLNPGKHTQKKKTFQFGM